MNIEIIYAILYGILFIIGILSVSRKMSMGIGLVGIAAGIGIAWVLAPYASIVMGPIGDAIFYGGDWTIAAILGLVHLSTMIALTIVATYNLLSSGGKIIWA